MFSVCRRYVRRDANTFSLNDNFHVRVANYVLRTVLHVFQNVSFCYLNWGGGGVCGKFFHESLSERWS